MKNLKPIKIASVAILLLTFVAANWFIYTRYYKEIELAHKPLKEDQIPEYLGEIRLNEGFIGDQLKPAWVYVYEDKLYVSYYDSENIDSLDLKGKKIESIRAKITKNKGAPQGLYRNGHQLLVTDFHNGGMGIFAESGRLIDAYYETAEKRAVKPVGVTVFENVFYLTDVNINGWMAVLSDGEMVMEVKGDNRKNKLEFPFGIVVTRDGRVVVTDPAGGGVKVFTCSGWFAYDIPVSQVGMRNPQGIAIDEMGRIHIVDNGVGKVFVFDNSGKFMFSYGKGLDNPSTVAIAQDQRVIYVANTNQGTLSVWGY